MKKLDAEKRVDKTFENAIKENTLETPPVNFTDRTMLKIRQTEITAKPELSYALGPKFKLFMWSIICSFIALIIIPPLLPHVEFSSLSSETAPFLESFPIDLSQLVTIETLLYLLVAYLGFVLVFLFDFFFTKRLVRVRS